ncbi:hypothetical protein EB815_25630 [Mesorhizobium loti]|uniref:Uncharacterized protein n=1 Tax=Rhizobium loti TaxID=381 RepID=A0A6M7U6B1_RHILI|nr:hypothetical protein A8145_05350 [Mesorhizobium loti]QKC72156.1 hypothetical protein EB815_25630 [Mesorhizobium loti]
MLRTIVDSKGNAGALQSDVITAVSTVLRSGHVEAGTALFETMDSVDLLELRRWAQAVQGKATLDEILSTVLLFRLAGPEKLIPKPTTKEVARLERNAALKAVRERKKKIRAAGDRQNAA